MGGDATQKALKNFNPLFCLNFSATHKQHHNLVYALDAVDAYNQRLVKKIEVKGFQVKNFRGTDKYLYLEEIIISPKHPPMARIELEISYNKSINREPRIVGVDDNLYEISNMEQYKGYRISEIDPIAGTVTFVNGEVIYRGDVVGDVSEQDMRRIQIRETIKSHLAKEEELFARGIKTLSLFFIDEVAKYRQYDDDGEELLGEYGRIFEQEYTEIVNDYITIFDTPYQQYLKSIEAKDTHKGYFSIDKKGHAVDSTIKKGADYSDDISAYDLILKNKERLLSFDEPVRFIFSHSALREGWDNPNVFQICTLKRSDSTVMKRQEVGRGLRLCVNQDGFRMDEQSLGKSLVHKINKLTVIASESYKDFVSDLQKQIRTDLYERPLKASIEYFAGKTITTADGQKETISDAQATAIYQYLIKNDYIDEDEHVTEQYRVDLENNNLAAMSERLSAYAEGIHKLIQSIFDEKVFNEMIANGNETTVPSNDLNDNFFKKEFQTLWGYINHKYAYTVSFDSNELIKKATERVVKFQADAQELCDKLSPGKQHYQRPMAISVYLWLHNPDKYCIFKYTALRKATVYLKNDFIPKKGNPVQNIRGNIEFTEEIRKLISQDEELVRAFRSVCDEACYADSNLLTLANDLEIYISSEIADSDDNGHWIAEDYDSGITKERWKELIADEKIFDERGIEVVTRMLHYGGQATCTQLADKYGENASYYNFGSSSLAKKGCEGNRVPVVDR